MSQAIELEKRIAELLSLKCYQEAAQLISEEIAQSGESSSLWNDWAVIHCAAGDHVDAERALRRALQLDSHNVAAAENLKLLLARQGKTAEGTPNLQAAIVAAEGPQRDVLAKLLEGNPGDSPAKVNVTENFIREAVHLCEAPGGAGETPTLNEYEDWFESVFHQRVAVPGVRIATSWTEDTPWGKRAHDALLRVECDYVQSLLEEIRDKQIEGDLAEFGIFQGWWVNFLWESASAWPDASMDSTALRDFPNHMRSTISRSGNKGSTRAVLSKSRAMCTRRRGGASSW